VVYLVGLINNI